jgi:tRNA pseudouridine synthase 10
VTSRLPAALHVYRLCEWCSRRQGDGGSFEAVKGEECYVCQGMTTKTARMAALALKEARRFEFVTFTVGVSLPMGVQEREDELRSDLKLIGRETVKAQSARLVAERVSIALGKRVEKLRPDLTLLADFVELKVTAASRPVFYYGRYTKPSGVTQRRELCDACGGSGCNRCRRTGFRQRLSVEGQLRKRLTAFSGSERMTFTWLGSEDRESTVYRPGRPFVAEVKSPRKGGFPKKFIARFRGGQVAVSSGRMLPGRPLRLPTFRFKTSILGESRTKVDKGSLSDLKRAFKNTQVRFDRLDDRPTLKTVYRASATARGRALLIDAELDGGLPVKRFVDGERVSPSVSEVLKTEVKCRNFDIREVKETGRFEFAEVARVEKKN